MATMTVTKMAPPMRVVHLVDSFPERILTEIAGRPIWTPEERARLTLGGPLDFLELADLLVNLIYPAIDKRGADLETEMEALLDFLMEMRPPEMAEMSIEEVLTAYMEMNADADDFVAMVEGLGPIVAPAVDSEERLAAREREAQALFESHGELRSEIRGLQVETNRLVRTFNEAGQAAVEFDADREAVTKETQEIAALAEKKL